MARWITQGRLVALDDNPGSRLPVWQFTSDTKHPVLPDVDKLLAAFPGGPVALSRWMVRPNDNFHGRTPAQQMTRDSALVLAIVATLAAT
ncbi:DUF2384 domain-containing protein [Rhodococcus hoagii]|nr:DUF2384 domain-containing protein [Prescottella equi]